MGAQSYLGYDEKTQGPYDSAVTTLSFPGIGSQAAELLVERRVAGVGIDTGFLSLVFLTVYVTLILKFHVRYCN